MRTKTTTVGVIVPAERIKKCIAAIRDQLEITNRDFRLGRAEVACDPLCGLESV
ncbi:MAG: hypothetical protein QM570_01305 [Planctomycetota bacterium]|nr:hypothetical protein [Planctomycetota bacterium]